MDHKLFPGVGGGVSKEGRIGVGHLTTDPHGHA